VTPEDLQQASSDGITLITLMLEHLRNDNPDVFNDMINLLIERSPGQTAIIVSVLSSISATLLQLLAEEWEDHRSPEELLQHVALGARLQWESGNGKTP
jgi:hypothetical protein